MAFLWLLRDKAAPPVRRWSLFLLVPVGRGVELGIPTAGRIEELFGWVYAVADGAPDSQVLAGYATRF